MCGVSGCASQLASQPAIANQGDGMDLPQLWNMPRTRMYIHISKSEDRDIAVARFSKRKQRNLTHRPWPPVCGPWCLTLELRRFVSLSARQVPYPTDYVSGGVVNDDDTGEMQSGIGSACSASWHLPMTILVQDCVLPGFSAGPQERCCLRSGSTTGMTEMRTCPRMYTTLPA